MANIYTIDQITTTGIPQSIGLLDNPTTFPPSNGYYLTITPMPGEIIAAKFFRMGASSIPMNLNLQDATANSQTQWPSKIEWIFPAVTTLLPIYKVVLQDSDNLINDPNFQASEDNLVYIWIYFGTGNGNLPGTVPITSTVNLDYTLDIDYDPDPLTLNDTLISTPGSLGGSPIITNSTI